MNKYQKRVTSYAKKLAGNTLEDAPLAKFEIARKYARGCIAFERCKSKRSIKRHSDRMLKWFVGVTKFQINKMRKSEEK